MADATAGNKQSARLKYFENHASKLHPAQEKLIKLTNEHPKAMMLSCSDSTALLTNILRFSNPKKCIDVGVYTGYSSLSWALNLPDDGKVIACDITDEYFQIGRPVLKEAGVEHKIDLRIAPAAHTLQSLIDAGEAGTYDFVYIDADKSGYDSYYELGLKLIRPGGIIAIDNSWWHGKVANPQDNDDSTTSIRKLNDKITADERVSAVLIDIGDGIHLCSKK